jgi:hypothetical protein
MSLNEQSNQELSDVVTVFTIAFVGLCRALEQQNKIMPDSIAKAIHAEMAEVPPGSKLHREWVKEMVMNIVKVVNGARIAEVHIPQGTR